MLHVTKEPVIEGWHTSTVGSGEIIFALEHFIGVPCKSLSGRLVWCLGLFISLHNGALLLLGRGLLRRVNDIPLNSILLEGLHAMGVISYVRILQHFR